MKNLIILLALVSMLMFACKSKEMAVVEEPPVEETVAEPVADIRPEPVEVLVVEERFTFDRSEDKLTHDDNTYFIILGSFSYKDNAERFVETLKKQGFSPVVLLSETGFHRVSVYSYDQEVPARTRIQQLRSNYPEYHDLWLLIRKQ
ncbi:MAG: SPOR domain-containing protein [Bacteroidales bacterium]|nr:SPOR domain-containing protein [Bacteroidales bacterium]